jgi:hypothetical protein
MENLFNTWKKNQITPNQYYIIHSIHKKVSSNWIKNELVELKQLNLKGFIEKKDTEYILTKKAISVIKETEFYFSSNLKKVSKKTMGSDFKENIKKFNEIFPKRRLKSGRPARSALSNVETCFLWFFKNNDYSWETIFKATEVYIRKMDYGENKYTTCSHYFVRKQNTADRSFNSILADYCELIEGGYKESNDVHFKENTFD